MTILGALVLLSASCFVRYLGWAFSYSARLGLSNQTLDIQLAYRRAWFFLSIFTSLQLIAAVILGSAWEPSNLGSLPLRFVARYGSALALVLVSTAIVVAIWLMLCRL